MSSHIVLNVEGVAEAMGRVADEVAKSIPAGVGVAVVGIRNRGDVLAQRLIDLLGERGVGSVWRGALDITLYRDDLEAKGGTAEVRVTEIDFNITGMYLVLVDDVLYTGRTVRAALTAWSVASPRLRHEIMHQGIERVELSRRNSEIAVTFARDPWCRFLPRQGGFSGFSVNRPVARE